MMHEAYKVLGVVAFGFAGGAMTGAAYFALINSIGMLNRAAAVSKTKKYILRYEDMSVLGAVLGVCMGLNIVVLRMPVIESIGWLLMVLLSIFTLVAGMFVGLLVVSLAENVKAIPILAKRTNIAGGIGYVIVALACGKAIGHILYYLYWAS